MQFYIIDTVGIQPTQQLVLQLDGGRFYWTACDFTLMIQLESNQRNSWCSNWTEGDFTLLRRRETALLGKGKSMSNNVNSHFPTGQEAREVGRPDSGFGRPGFRVWATRIPGLGDSSFGSRVQRLWSRDSVRDSSGEAIARGRFMNRCRLCIKRAAPGRLGAAEAGSGARRRLGAARMRRGTYAEPPRHAGAHGGADLRQSCQSCNRAATPSHIICSAPQTDQNDSSKSLYPVSSIQNGSVAEDDNFRHVVVGSRPSRHCNYTNLKVRHRVFCCAPRPRPARGRNFFAPRAPCAPAPLPTLALSHSNRMHPSWPSPRLRAFARSDLAPPSP